MAILEFRRSNIYSDHLIFLFSPLGTFFGSLGGEGEKSWRRRPIAVLSILLVAVALGTFTSLADNPPWSPVMNAWSGDPIPPQYLEHRTALERQGALIFQLKQCRNCHSLGNDGGKRGPIRSAARCA